MPSLPTPGRPSRERLPALALVALAVALVAGSGWLVYDDFRPSYSLTVTQVGADPADADSAALADAPATDTADAEVLAVADLPPEAKVAFEKARDGGYLVHREPAWLETFPLYDSVYVRADGTVYELWARSDGLDGFSVILGVPVVLLAVGLAALGARSYRREDARTPLTALAALGAAAAVAFGWPFPGTLFVAGIGVGPAKVGILAALAAGIGTWVGLDRYDLA